MESAFELQLRTRSQPGRNSVAEAGRPDRKSQGDCPFKNADGGERLVDPSIDGEICARGEEHPGGEQQVQHHPLVALKDLHRWSERTELAKTRDDKNLFRGNTQTRDIPFQVMHTMTSKQCELFFLTYRLWEIYFIFFLVPRQSKNIFH
jgi:hypothetical protein